MIQPAYLQKGDTIAIIATARKVSREEIQPAVDFFESCGWNVTFGKHLFSEENQFAGSDEQRVSDLQVALDDKHIKAIVIARGGYGTVRLMPSIDFKHFKQYPKWVVGYSDVTVLHNAIHQAGVATLHATMPINFTKNIEATRSLADALCGHPLALTADSNSLNRLGDNKGLLVGGNLSILYALSGTTCDLDTKNKILFIEDLDEQLYHIDRMMLQLKRSGKLKNLKGLIVGGMSDMKDNAIPYGKTAEEIIYEAVKEYKYPVCFNFPAGHIKNNTAIYFGKKARLEISKEKISLRYI